jgi:hypothetical protein
MSEENVEVVRGVRTPVAVSIKTRPRTLDERIVLRFPALFRMMAAAWSRLPPRSRLRRAVTARVVRQGIEAFNRGDFELLFVGFDPAIEFVFAESLAEGYVPPDLVGVHRGHGGYLRMREGLTEAWEDIKLEPEEVIDFGDRLLTAGRVTANARHTRITLDTPLFSVATLRRGLVVRQRDFLDRAQALEAAGLSE